MVALLDNHIDIIDLLLNNGADPNSENMDGRTGLVFRKSENVLHKLFIYGLISITEMEYIQLLYIIFIQGLGSNPFLN